MAYELGRADEAACHLARMHTLVQPGWSPLLRRFVHNANAQVQRQQGEHEAFLASSRELQLLFRGPGAQGEAWMASLLLMLAEADRGQTAAALAVGQQALEEIRQAGRLRQYTQLLAMHTALRACGGEVAAARGAQAEALPLRQDLGGEFLLLALAWLALHEGRHPSAARFQGHYQATQRSAGADGPGSLAHRLAEGLAQPLQHSLGPAAFEALCQAGGSLGDEAALQEGLGAELPLEGGPLLRS